MMDEKPRNPSAPAVVARRRNLPSADFIVLAEGGWNDDVYSGYCLMMMTDGSLYYSEYGYDGTPLYWLVSDSDDGRACCHQDRHRPRADCRAL